jgi:hypothetical protein
MGMPLYPNPAWRPVRGKLMRPTHPPPYPRGYARLLVLIFLLSVAILLVFPPSLTIQQTRVVRENARLNLSKVAWEGGSTYWNKWSSTRPWANPAFFPIGVWYESVTTQLDIDLDKAVGLNTYVELTANSKAALIHNAGMWSVSDTPLAGYGTETVGWLLADEPDIYYKSGNDPWNGTDGWNTCIPIQSKGGKCGYTVLAKKKAQRSAPHYANYGKDVLFLDNDTDAAQFVNGYTDWLSLDEYWYSETQVCAGGTKRIPGSGPINPITRKPELTPAECHRAANYGVNVDRARTLDAKDGKLQPIWAFVEVGHPMKDAATPSITGPQIKGAVMSSLIHGARGIIYFNHSFGGSCISYHVLREKCGSAVRPEVTALNQQITRLAPVLNTQSLQWTFSPNLDTMLKQTPDGANYIFAMMKGGVKPGPQTFTLPSGLTSTAVTVVDENRTLPVTGGSFTDWFAAENSYHIYKIVSATSTSSHWWSRWWSWASRWLGAM